MFYVLVSHEKDGAFRILVKERFYFGLDLVLGSRLSVAFQIDLFAFDYLTSRVRHFTDDMSLASSEITELILEKENA